MGGSSEHRVTETLVEARFAPYLEAYHESFLAFTHNQSLAAIAVNPYSTYASTWADIDYAFFCVGCSISDYPALYDMFGKHMSGLDIEIFHRDNFKNLFDQSEVNNHIAEEMRLADEDLVANLLSKFQVAARDMNTVTSSSFVVGKAAVEGGRVRKLSEVSSEKKFELLFDPQAKSNTFLNWNKNIVTNYAQAMKLYYMTAMTTDESNYKFKTYSTLWPFIVLDFERAAIAALRGKLSGYQRAERRQRSPISKGLLIAQYAATGAIVGASIGGGWGAVIGAVVGAIVGVAIMLLE